MGRTTPAYRCGGSRGFRAKGRQTCQPRAAPHSRFTRRGRNPRRTPAGTNCSPPGRPRRAPAPTGPACYNSRPFTKARLPRVNLPPRGRAVADKAVAKKLFIRTFGCQMNEYDSDKMADVLHASEGLTRTDRPEDADVILFNTCSVRENAQERVFHDLGRMRELKLANPDIVIGVGGCVASQEGAAIVRRAPYVDIVFGPQTLHRLPQLMAARRASGRAQVDICFPEIEKFDRLPPPRVEGPSAFVSIMEGCSKYCSFCVVPYTRGEEVSRPFDDVLTEIADLADQGVMEITLLGQNVNAYRGAMGARRASERRRRGPGDAARIRRGNPGHRAHPLHDVASEGNDAAAHRRLRDDPEAGRAPAPARAVRLRPHPRGDEARLHGARIQVDRPPRAGRPAGNLADVRFHRRLSRRNRRRFRADDEAGGRRRISTARSASCTARAPGRLPPSCRTRRRRKRSAHGSPHCRHCSTRSTARTAKR